MHGALVSGTRHPQRENFPVCLLPCNSRELGVPVPVLFGKAALQVGRRARGSAFQSKLQASWSWMLGKPSGTNGSLHEPPR